MSLPASGSPSSSLLPSPDRLRTLAEWLDEAGSPQMASAARVAAHQLEDAEPAHAGAPEPEADAATGA